MTLKQQLEEKGKEVKQARQDVNKKSKEINDFRQQIAMLTQSNRSLEQEKEILENDLKHNEEEINILRSKVSSLQDALTSPSGDPRSSALNRLLTEHPAPQDVSYSEVKSKDQDIPKPKFRKNFPKTSDVLSPFEMKTKECRIVGLRKTKSISESQKHFRRSPCKEKTNNPDKNSYINTKTLSQPSTSRLQSSIPQGIVKKSRFDDLKSPSPIAPSHMFYDGLGGHSKLDRFPTIARKDFNIKPTSYNISKKPKGVSRPKNSKPTLKDDSVKPIDNFFSTLT